ncbi:hypothetical protein [Streptomyces sp. bgisy126]
MHRTRWFSPAEVLPQATTPPTGPAWPGKRSVPAKTLDLMDDQP